MFWIVDIIPLGYLEPCCQGNYPYFVQSLQFFIEKFSFIFLVKVFIFRDLYQVMISYLLFNVLTESLPTKYKKLKPHNTVDNQWYWNIFINIFPFNKKFDSLTKWFWKLYQDYFDLPKWFKLVLLPSLRILCSYQF